MSTNITFEVGLYRQKTEVGGKVERMSGTWLCKKLFATVMKLYQFSEFCQRLAVRTGISSINEIVVL
jgi:hypothetical protein